MIKKRDTPAENERLHMYDLSLEHAVQVVYTQP